jgi:hypothetical protein
MIKEYTDAERAQIRQCMSRHLCQEKLEAGQAICEVCHRAQFENELCALARVRGEEHEPAK